MGFKEDKLNKELREKQRDERIHEETVKQLRTEERFVHYLSQFRAVTVEQFIKHYATHKVFWYRYGGNHAKRKKRKQKEARQQVLACFKRIMQKKIFDLKCRWVSGEMNLAGIEHSAQFNNWEHNAELLQAVEPIRPDEFLCFLHWFEYEPEYIAEYGKSETSEDEVFEIYHKYRSRADKAAKDLIPPWFREYDRHFGTAGLLDLPTPRTNLEQDYLDDWVKEIYHPSLSTEERKYLCFADRATRIRMQQDPAFKKEWLENANRLSKEKETAQPQYEDFSVRNRKIMDEVVEALEDYDLRKRYRMSERWKEVCRISDRHRSELRKFKKVEEHVAVSSNKDYWQGIKQAYQQHQHQTIYHELERIFEEYETCLHKALPFDWGESPHTDGYYKEERKRILAVRNQKGLPENFDFLMKENLS
jgi:hypothetical protein